MSIHVKNINHVYNEGLPDETAALIDVSVDINDGEFVGSSDTRDRGKSTFLQHLNGF